ncbi:MAG: glycosyltransferase family 9 protein [Leptospirales bacterium]
MINRVNPSFPPILNAKDLSKDFSGTFYHLFGQGLGDTVNALRIQSTIQEIYPGSRSIIYCDERWLDLVAPLPNCSIRLYPKAHDPRYTKGGVIGPEEEALQSIMNEKLVNSFLAYHSSPLPHQLSEGESTQESIVRSLGLFPYVPEFRPFVPMRTENWNETETVLQKYNLTPGQFFVIAPHTWPSKDWGKENFETLGATLHQRYGLPGLVAGIPELGRLEFPGALNLFGLPLPVIAGLIARSRLFIGLDSGLSHLAATFDIPLVVLYSKGQIPAFEIRVHSPFASLVLEPAPGTPISIETVLGIVGQRLRSPLLKPPECPACNRPMMYVIEALKGFLNRRCVCGTQRLERTEEILATGISDVDETPSSPLPSGNDALDNLYPGQEKHPPSSLEELKQFNFWINGEQPHSFTLSLNIQNPYKPILIPEIPAEMMNGSLKCWFQWSLDGTFQFFRSKGYLPVHLENKRFSSKVESAISFKKKPVEESPLEIPWGGRILKVSGYGLYFSYFSWQSWATPIRWVALSKKVLLHEGALKAFRVASAIFFMDPGPKTFKYLLRSSLMTLFPNKTLPPQSSEVDSKNG